jgi:hypothetical protein
MNRLFIIILGILFLSCTDENIDTKQIKSVLIGTWTIDSYECLDSMSFSPLMSNLISFKKNSEFKFPSIDLDHYKLQLSKDNKYSLILYSLDKDDIIDLKLEFINDSINKLLNIKLVSDKFYLRCSKMLYNYDNNINEINELVRITNIKK